MKRVLIRSGGLSVLLFCLLTSGSLSNPPVFPGFGPTEQNNAELSWSEASPLEVYSAFTHHPNPGTYTPSTIGVSLSMAGGVTGSWLPAWLNPTQPFVNDANSALGSLPPQMGHFLIHGSWAGPAFTSGSPNGIVMHTTPGGGAPFGPGTIVAMPMILNSWYDYPDVAVNDYGTVPPPEFGTAVMAWTETRDFDGDPNLDGDFFNDGGDQFAIWTSVTNTIAGPFLYPAVSPAVALAVAIPVFPFSMASQRPSVDIAPLGNPFLPPGGAYVAWRDAAAGNIMLAANPAPGAGAPWMMAFPAVGGIPPVPPVINGGIHVANTVSIATSKLAGPCPGYTYLVWEQPGMLGDIDVYFSSSLMGGQPGTWGPPVRVNQDMPSMTPHDQWAPHMVVDPGTGIIRVTYYDRRSDPANTLVETWVSTSRDCGMTWTDCMISRTYGAPPVTTIPFPPPGSRFIGTYLGSDVNSLARWAAVWNDGRNGGDQDVFFENGPCVCCLPAAAIRGDVTGSAPGVPDGVTDASDLQAFVDFIFFGLDYMSTCFEHWDCNGDLTGRDPGDLQSLVDYIFNFPIKDIKLCNGSLAFP